jgi:hypothetical protein
MIKAQQVAKGIDLPNCTLVTGREFKFVPQSDCGVLIDGEPHQNDLIHAIVKPGIVNMIGFLYAPGDN